MPRGTAKALPVPAAAQDQIEPAVTVQIRDFHRGRRLHLQQRPSIHTVAAAGVAPYDLEVVRVHVREDQIKIAVLVEIGGARRERDARVEFKGCPVLGPVARSAAPINQAGGFRPRNVRSARAKYQVEVAVTVEVGHSDTRAPLHAEIAPATGAESLRTVPVDQAVWKCNVHVAVLIKITSRGDRVIRAG